MPTEPPTFAEEARDALGQAVAYLGTETALQSPQLRAALNDLCPGRPEINLLLAAQASGVPVELHRASFASFALLRRLGANLAREHFLPPEAAAWAVESWAVALGRPIECPPEELPPAPILPTPASEPPGTEDDPPDRVEETPEPAVRPWSALLLPAAWYARSGRPFLAAFFAVFQGAWFIAVALVAYDVTAGFLTHRNLVRGLALVAGGGALGLVLALPGFLLASGRERPDAASERAWNVRAALAVGVALAFVALALPLYPRFAGAPPWWEAALRRPMRLSLPADARVLAVSGDGRVFLSVRGASFDVGAFGLHVECLLLAGNRGARTTRQIRAGALSPDAGEAVLVLDGAGVAFYDAREGAFAAKSSPPLPAPARCAAYSPDGALLALGLENGDVVVLDARTATVRARHRLFLSAPHPILAVAVTDEGQVLAAAWNLGLVAAEASGEEMDLIVGADADPAAALAISPDGTRIVYVRKAAGHPTTDVYRGDRPFKGGVEDARFRVPVPLALDVVPDTIRFSDDGARLLTIEDGRATVLPTP